MKTKLTITLAVCLLLAGCSSLFKTVIAITDIRNSVMNELGKQYRLGNIDAATDAKISAADKKYRDAADAAQIVLETYKATKQGDTVAAINAVRDAAMALVDILATYQDASAIYSQLSKATVL